MVFAYYRRLSAARRNIYRRSDRIHAIRLPRAEALRPLVFKLAAALKNEDRPRVERACRQLAQGVVEHLGVPPVTIKVLAVRPQYRWGELHGLYDPVGRRRPRITLWMRTAQRQRVVAFRSFLRTLLHELCHHLDDVLLKLPESFHTEGFYKRESSLFHQLVGDSAPSAASR
jgi:hypothetical protein